MHTVAIDTIPVAEVLALFIGEPSVGQRHIGLAYRPRRAAPLRFLHLAWHKNLRDDATLGSRYRGVMVAAVPRALHETIVAHCKRSAKADLDPQHLEYGLGYPRATIRRDGSTDVMIVENASGLTCATFVLAIFKLAGRELVDTVSWKDRDGDVEWKANVVAFLTESLPEASERVVKLRADKDLVRVRPEDVAGAATASAHPVGFDVATAAGDSILSEL